MVRGESGAGAAPKPSAGGPLALPAAKALLAAGGTANAVGRHTVTYTQPAGALDAGAGERPSVTLL